MRPIIHEIFFPYYIVRFPGWFGRQIRFNTEADARQYLQMETSGKCKLIKRLWQGDSWTEKELRI